MTQQYTILIDYTTGDSFSSEDCYDEEIGFVFESGELAVKAAKLIRDHCKFVEDHERFGTTPNKSLKEKIKDCIQSEWYENYCKAGGTRDYEKYWDHVCSRIGFEVAPGEFKFLQYPFWIGYFETLNQIKVRKVSDKHEVDISVYG